MTIHDPKRQWARPVEEVARAMSLSKLWPIVFEAGTAQSLATIAITRLRELGFLNENALAALRAEERGRSENG